MLSLCPLAGGTDEAVVTLTAVACSAVKMLCSCDLGSPPQFSCILFVSFLFSDGNITDNIFIVQIDDQDDGKRFKSFFHWDMKSKDGAAAPNRQPLVDEVKEEL